MSLEIWRTQASWPFRYGMPMLVALAFVCLFFSFREYSAAEAALLALQQHPKEASSAAAQSTNDPAALQAQELELQAARSTIQNLATPWTRILGGVYEAAGSEVALLTLEPDVKLATMNVAGEAATRDAMLGYLKRLMKNPFFTSVKLRQHSINTQDPLRPVLFALSIEWQRDSTKLP